jgi:hypothetical protein
MLEDRLNQPADCPNMVPLDAEDVLQLLRSEIEHAGGLMAFSKEPAWIGLRFIERLRVK